MFVCRMELDAINVSTTASCAAAHITTEPTKEVRTTFYPPKHPDKVDNQPTVRLVCIQVHMDTDANMKNHIAKVLSNARIAKTRLV